MAKIIRYQLCTRVNHGTQEQPQIEEILTPVIMGWNEINEAIAKKEAWGGEYAVEDDGQERPRTTENRLQALEEALQDLPGMIRETVSALLTGWKG